jgi:hypothetical protein
MLIGGCWLLGVFASVGHAQAPVRVPASSAAQLMMPQAPVTMAHPDSIAVRAMFSPPTTIPGGKTFYRVEVEAAQNIIQWPDTVSAPPELKFGESGRGQIVLRDGNTLKATTSYVYEVTPAAAGRFVISNFVVQAGGLPVVVPAASLVVTETAPANAEPPRQLLLEASHTNLFAGEPFLLRVLMPSGPKREIEALRDVQLNGRGLLTDKMTAHQVIQNINLGGVVMPAFIYETVATPITVGAIPLSAQAFTAGREFSGSISISGNVTIPGGPPSYSLVISDTLTLNVRPLPSEFELPGFTGAIGQFIADRPQLSASEVEVGTPIHLKFGFHSVGSLTRFVPPNLPRSRDWQIIEDDPPGTGCTLIPLTDEATNTPAIPFCAFNPQLELYYDLSVPAQPVNVTGKGLPTQLTAWNDEKETAAPLKLSALATSPGKTVSSLMPLQLRGWFMIVQLLPVIGFVALWRWDERRRFLEAHPEIVRRKKAKRELSREKIKLRKAIAAGDEAAFVRHAAQAMRIAVAPHLPAETRAMVGGDALAQLDEAERRGPAGETIRRVFAAADAEFASQPPGQSELLNRAADVEAVLQKLEGKL